MLLDSFIALPSENENIEEPPDDDTDDIDPFRRKEKEDVDDGWCDDEYSAVEGVSVPPKTEFDVVIPAGPVDGYRSATDGLFAIVAGTEDDNKGGVGLAPGTINEVWVKDDVAVPDDDVFGSKVDFVECGGVLNGVLWLVDVQPEIDVLAELSSPM